jgi:hypothetical protein
VIRSIRRPGVVLPAAPTSVVLVARAATDAVVLGAPGQVGRALGWNARRRTVSA